MIRRACEAWVLVLGTAMALAGDDRQDQAPAPAEEYEALLQESPKAAADLAKARSDQERQAALARVRALPLRFLELAEKNPRDPIALEALIQTVVLVNGTAFPTGGEGSPGHRALELIRRDHVTSEKLGRVCQQVVFGFHKSHETFLRAVVAENSHREVQALARLSLAQFLTNRLDRLEVLDAQDRPDLAERYHLVFGKDYVEELRQEDHTQVAAEAERLFALADEYDEVPIPVTFYGSGGTVGEKARAALFQIRHLAVGKVAPDIEGEDQDGQPFKLSDYRGKVVLLDFWHHT
jgi:hypothetical protein